MHAGFWVFDLFARIGTVAGITQKALLFDDHPGNVAGMGVMALEAFSVFKKFVVRPGTFLCFHEIAMAADTQFGVIRHS